MMMMNHNRHVYAFMANNRFGCRTQGKKIKTHSIDTWIDSDMRKVKNNSLSVMFTHIIPRYDPPYVKLNIKPLAVSTMQYNGNEMRQFEKIHSSRRRRVTLLNQVNIKRKRIWNLYQRNTWMNFVSLLFIFSFPPNASREKNFYVKSKMCI